VNKVAPALLFNDLKIIELAGVLAGPAAGTFFAELGAKVIKVENSLTGGDVTRTWKHPGENPSSHLSAYFHSVNFNKESLFVNLQTESDRNKIYDLVKESDIVISNYTSRVALKLGMDYDTLRNINPGIIYAQLKGFEENERAAFDAIVQAETGYMKMNGTRESGPLKMPVAFMDIIAAHLLKEGILTALIYKYKTGKGSYLETSLEKAALSSLMNQASNYLNNGKIPEAIGSLHPNIAPYGETFLTEDNKLIILAVGSDEQFLKLCKVLGLNETIDSEMYQTNTARVYNRKELSFILADSIAKFSLHELTGWFNKIGIPFGEIKDLQQVLDQPHVQSLILKQVEADGSKSKRMMTAAFDIYTK